ncbi:GNAT family N-acetyltransferase [Sporosarcina sp. A2]|uniref:GNAT family N-acetyltransferase n=1 Tax=Sporosarcina sp. A2 TaxID=3393449 RepID=UPI003D78E6FC
MRKWVTKSILINGESKVYLNFKQLSRGNREQENVAHFVNKGQVINLMYYEIRSLERHDLRFLREMVYESAFVPEGQRPFPRTILDEPSVSKFFDGWGEQSDDIGLIAERGEQPVGAIWLRLFDKEQKSYGDEETPEIGMAILKEFRGKGIGSTLMGMLETQAKNYGYQKLFLSVDPRNPARRLYEHLGYEHVGWDETFWAMEKELV